MIRKLIIMITAIDTFENDNNLPLEITETFDLGVTTPFERGINLPK